MDDELKKNLIKVEEVYEDKIICLDVEGNILTVKGEFKFSKGDVLQFTTDNYYIKYHSSSAESACLFVTNQCNSNCLMCPDTTYSRRRKNDINLEFLKDFLMLLPTDLPYLDITGGEPTLLKNNLITIIDMAFNHFENIDIMILSNGRAFADKCYAMLFEKYSNKNLIIEVPLHGFDSQTHDYIAGGNGYFSQTASGIYNLLNSRVSIGIRIVVSKLNYKYIYKIINYIGKTFRNVKYINIMGLEMLGNARTNIEKVWIEFDDVKDILQKNIELCFMYGIEPRLYNFPLCLFEKKYWSVYRKSISPHKVVYLENCSGCSIKNYCGGFFKSTANITKYMGKGDC